MSNTLAALHLLMSEEFRLLVQYHITFPCMTCAAENLKDFLSQLKIEVE